MPSPPPAGNDEMLRPFLEARTDEEDEAALCVLLDIARPIIHNVLRRKVLLFNSHGDPGDDLRSLGVMRVLESLRRCKHSGQEGDDVLVIRHFPGLCQVIAITVANEHLRFKFPRRASFQNQLLYLFREAKNARHAPVFALWRDADEQLCGLYAWQGRALETTARARSMLEQPDQTRHAALRGESATTMSLQRVLELLFAWLGVPAAFDVVVGATARWRGIEDRSDLSLSGSSEDDSPIFEPVSPDLSPEEQTILGEHLRELWRRITQLPVKQRAALLLNLCDGQGRGVLGFLPALGIAGFHEIARALEMEARDFAILWPQLPLDDRAIAKIYGCDASVVPVWRSRARARLKKQSVEL